MAVLSGVPVAMASDDHDPDAPAILLVLITGVRPDPASAEAVTDDVVGAGLVLLLPVRKFHVAIGRVMQLGGGGADVTVSVPLAVFPVSSDPMKRLLETLL